jgi:hypothetical protein
MPSTRGNTAVSASQELVAAVRQATEGTPYTVQERPYGFDVTIDVVDARWYTLLRANGLKKVFTYEVRLDEGARKLSITDVANTVTWSGGSGLSGSPSLRAERSFQRGRVYQYSMGKEVGVDARTGEPGLPVDYSFSASEGRDLVRRAARAAGWSEKMGGEQLGAVIFAGAIVAVGAVVGLVFLAMWVFG